jgi:hypothetical protein
MPQAHLPANCEWRAFDALELALRVRDHLGVELFAGVALSTSSGGSASSAWTSPSARRAVYAKFMDLKHLWPAIFPELSARHEWMGVSDLDILYGDLFDELSQLRATDELLVPLGYFPTPLANGNLVFMRTTSKMLHAYRHAAWWREMLASTDRWVFDERQLV